VERVHDFGARLHLVAMGVQLLDLVRRAGGPRRSPERGHTNRRQLAEIVDAAERALKPPVGDPRPLRLGRMHELVNRVASADDPGQVESGPGSGKQQEEQA
jgi:hypothetical protein